MSLRDCLEKRLLRETAPDPGKGRIPLRLVNSLDSYRMERHELLYGFEFAPSGRDVEVLIGDARALIGVVESLLGRGS